MQLVGRPVHVRGQLRVGPGGPVAAVRRDADRSVGDRGLQPVQDQHARSSPLVPRPPVTGAGVLQVLRLPAGNPPGTAPSGTVLARRLTTFAAWTIFRPTVCF